MSENITQKSTKSKSNLTITILFIICGSIGVSIGINKYKKSQTVGTESVDLTIPAEVSVSSGNQTFVRQCTGVKFKFLDKKGAPVKTAPIFISARDDKNLLTLFKSGKCDLSGLPTAKMSVPEGSTEFEVFFTVAKAGPVFIEVEDAKSHLLKISGITQLDVMDDPNYFDLTFENFPKKLSMKETFQVSIRVKDSKGDLVDDSSKEVLLELVEVDPNLPSIRLGEVAPVKGVAVFNKLFFTSAQSKALKFRATLRSGKVETELLPNEEFSPYFVSFDVEGLGKFYSRIVRPNVAQIYGEPYELKIVNGKRTVNVKGQEYSVDIIAPLHYVLKKR